MLVIGVIFGSLILHFGNAQQFQNLPSFNLNDIKLENVTQKVSKYTGKGIINIIKILEETQTSINVNKLWFLFKDNCDEIQLFDKVKEFIKQVKSMIKKHCLIFHFCLLVFFSKNTVNSVTFNVCFAQYESNTSTKKQTKKNKE